MKLGRLENKGKLLMKLYKFQFMAVAETWFITKLRDKNGNAIVNEKGKTNSSLVFAWLMTEMIFSFGGGSLGYKHEKLHRFVDDLIIKGVDFDEPENFVRLVYSVIEYLGGYRSEDLINRR